MAIFKNLAFLFLLYFCLSCNKTTNKADEIVNKCIEAHGGKAYNHFNVSFDFRDKHFILKRNKNTFTYTRIGTDSLKNEIKDIYQNDTFIRKLNGKAIETPDTMIIKYKNSINSVAYFALLPFPLNDEAANKSFIGQSTIANKLYNKIKVIFTEKNGGKDHDDEYIYWINAKTNLIDYFAYSYKVDGGGLRFRKSIKSQTVNGIKFQNYINYSPKNQHIILENIEKEFIEGNLIELSRIENLNLK